MFSRSDLGSSDKYKESQVVLKATAHSNSHHARSSTWTTRSPHAMNKLAGTAEES